MLQRTADAKAASSDLPDSQPAESGGVRAGLTLTTRLAVAMIVLVAGAVFAVGWLSYRSLEQALIPRVLERIETHSRFMAADLESHVRSAPGDITTFANLAAVAGLVRARLNGGIDPVDQTTEAAWRQRLQGRLAAQMALKPAYSLRVIGIADNHREIVRVDRSGAGGSVHIAAMSAPLAAKTNGRLSCIEGSPPGRANRPGVEPGRERGRRGKMVRLSGNQHPGCKPREQATNVRSYLHVAIHLKQDIRRY